MSQTPKMNSHEEKTPGYVWMILALIVLSGSFMRLYGLERESLWLDELATVRRSGFGTVSEVMRYSLYDPHPPGHYIIIHLITRYIGDSEFWLRFPSAIAGILSTIMIFYFARELFTYKEGLMSSAFMAFLWTPIHYSQEARSYSMLLLTTMVSAHYLLKILRDIHEGKEPKSTHVIIYSLSILASAYLHYFGLFFLILQGMYSIVFLRYNSHSFKHIFRIFAFPFLGYIPWIPNIVYQLLKSTTGAEWIPEPSPIYFLYYIAFIFDNSNIMIALVVAVHLIPLLKHIPNIMGWKVDLRQAITSQEFTLAMWVWMPFLVIYIKSILSSPLLVVRYLIFTLPAAYILFARSINKLPIRSTFRWLIFIGANLEGE